MREEFPKGFFQKPRPIATHETLADISEPMQVSEEVLSGKKKLLLTTEEPDNEKYYRAEIIGIDNNNGDWCDFWSEIEPIVDKYFGDEWCGTSKPNYDIDRYLKDGWIPATERLPDDEEDYLVTDGESMAVGFYRKEAKAWDNVNFGWLEHREETCGLKTVIAWMPLPKQYTLE